MRPGSHHFIAYTFNQSMPDVFYPEPFEYRDLRDEDGNYIQENMIVLQRIIAFPKFCQDYVIYVRCNNLYMQFDAPNVISSKRWVSLA